MYASPAVLSVTPSDREYPHRRYPRGAPWKGRPKTPCIPNVAKKSQSSKPTCRSLLKPNPASKTVRSMMPPIQQKLRCNRRYRLYGGMTTRWFSLPRNCMSG